MRRTTLFSVVLLLMFMGAGPAQAATITVETQDNQFVPADANVQAGDTVSFRNTGQAPHNAQSPDRKIFIDIINPGESKDVVISEGGTISYVCTFHETLGMRGTITVEGAVGAAPAGATETPSPGASPTATASPEATPAAAGATPSPGATPAEEGEDEGAPGVEEDPPLESPVTEKYLPPIGAAIFVLMLLGLGAPFKQHLKPVLRSAPPTYEPAPVGAPASIASPVAVAAPAAAAAPAPPAAAPAPPAAAPAPPAAAPAAPAAPAPAAPAPAAPAAPAGPALDPDQVYKAVLAEETGKGTDPRVAEARAKAAQMRTQEAQATTPAAPAAEAPAPAAAPEAAAPAEAPAPAAETAPEAAAPEAAAPAAPAGKAMSDEEAAEIRRKVYEEEMAKGSDPRVAEGRAKSAELRAKKGTYQPK